MGVRLIKMEKDQDYKEKNVWKTNILWCWCVSQEIQSQERILCKVKVQSETMRFEGLVDYYI